MTLLVWRGLEEWLAEACEVTVDGDQLHAWGVQLGAEPHPYCVDYTLTTGADWVTESLYVSSGGRRMLDLIRAPDGSWTANGEPLPDLQGALDCDLAFSPLTNFMPARRLTGDVAEYVMAWVSLPDFSVRRSEQRYERLDERRVRFIELDGDFTADLDLDEDGFVIRYPRLAERVPSGARA